MKIGIDGNEANVNHRVGVHQYAFEILWSLYKINGDLESPHTFVIYLKNDPSSDLPTPNVHWRYKVLPGGGVWIIRKLMPELVMHKDIDIFFTPSHYAPLVSRVPVVTTIHDLGYLEFSAQFKKYDFWQLKLWTAISIFISKGIISVSEFTKKDIVRHYKFASKKTYVVHHGYDKSKYNNNISDTDVRRIRKKYKLPNNYILFLSTLKPSKNIEGLLEAFKIIMDSSKFDEYKLVIAGAKGWLYETIFKKVEDLNLGDHVIFTGFVDERDKPALYYGSYIFVLPSFWEGFGIPVIEALASGSPVVVSDVASLPEVAGDVGVYVDPKDVKSISDGLLKVLNLDKNGYDKLSQKGMVLASRFSWRKAGEETLSILERVSSK